MDRPIPKRARLHEAEPKQQWANLEPGIWESVFEGMSVADKRQVRLVCKLFKDSASRTIHHLDLVHCSTMDGKNQRLPGSFQHIRTLKTYANRKLDSTHGTSLHSFSKLKELRYDGWGQQMKEGNLRAICSLTNLRSLSLSDCQLDAASGLSRLTRLANLDALELHRCQPQGNGTALMAIIGSLTGLQQLEITKPYTFCDRGYSQLSSLQDLTSLELGHSWMLGAGPEPLDFLNSMTLLQKLSITKCFVRDEDLRPIRQLVDLQLLGLCEANRLSGTVFEHLTGLTKLEGLTLEGSNQMTDEGVACVAMLTTLKQLHLGSSTCISLEACKKALPALTGLMRLRLPAEVLKRWPAADVCQTFPMLESCIAAPRRQARTPGIIEDNLQRWAIQQPALLATGRLQILDWFHDSRC